jgi:type IV secretory pathway VirB2 component (pilin)
VIAAISNSDLSTILVVLGIVCLGGAAYLAYLRNALGCALLIVVAIVCFLAAD